MLKHMHVPLDLCTAAPSATTHLPHCTTNPTKSQKQHWGAIIFFFHPWPRSTWNFRCSTNAVVGITFARARMVLPSWHFEDPRRGTYFWLQTAAGRMVRARAEPHPRPNVTKGEQLVPIYLSDRSVRCKVPIGTPVRALGATAAVARWSSARASGLVRIGIRGFCMGAKPEGCNANKGERKRSTKGTTKVLEDGKGNGQEENGKRKTTCTAQCASAFATEAEGHSAAPPLALANANANKNNDDLGPVVMRHDQGTFRVSEGATTIAHGENTLAIRADGGAYINGTKALVAGGVGVAQVPMCASMDAQTGAFRFVGTCALRGLVPGASLALTLGACAPAGTVLRLAHPRVGADGSAIVCADAPANPHTKTACAPFVYISLV